MAATSAVIGVLIVLEGPKDWDEWISTVRLMAEVREVKEWVDVDGAEPPPLVRPERRPYSAVKAGATTIAELDDIEREIYNLEYQDYQIALNHFERRQKGYADILDYILSTVAHTLRPYIKDITTPYGIIQALKTRVAPTDRARKLEIAKAYAALKRAPRAQGIDKWLTTWEVTYMKAARLGLPEAFQDRPLFDFLESIKAIDPRYALMIEVLANRARKRGEEPPTVYEAIEEFRDHLRLTRAKTKAGSAYSTFATLQGETQGSPSTTAEAYPSVGPATPKSGPTCLCGDIHFFNNCPYLIEQRRPVGWAPNEDILAEIEAKLASNPRLRKTVEFKRRHAREGIKPRPHRPVTLSPATAKTMIVIGHT